jgi:AAA+ superfamily predicted ATPase
MAVSAELLTLIERIRARATQLVGGSQVPPIGPADATQGGELAGHVQSRLPLLAETFGLSELGMASLVCLTAAEYDPYLRHVLRILQSDGGRPWLELGTISELLDLPLGSMPELVRLFAPESAFRRFALVEVDERVSAPGPFRRAKVDGCVAEYLAGIDAFPHGTTLVNPGARLEQSLVPLPVRRTAAAQLRRALGTRQPLAVEITGAPGGGRRFFSEALAQELGRKLLVVDLAAAERVDQAWAAGRRDAALHGALLCFANWDAHTPRALPQENAAPAPRALPPGMATFLRELDGVVLLTAEEHEPLVEQLAPGTLRVDVPFPTPSQRAELLAATLGTAPLAEDVNLPALARRFALPPGRIRAAARSLRQATDEGALTTGLLAEACGRQLRHDLKSVAVRITNNHCWDDLVVAAEVEDTLREMIAYVRHAARVYDDWGFGARHSLSQGISALFSGPPGTGKTMCASVIAQQLDMELFRVDLATVVSKWVGETEKNLARIFDEAQRSSAIILFDEADSLFAKRTEVKSANDRHANMEVNFLLQRMEQFSGISILTSNHEDAIDPAFKRRLTFRLRFEKPTVEERTQLWRRMFPKNAWLDRDVDAEVLAHLYDLCGGSIRNAAVRAAFLAAAEERPLDLRTCLVAAERECTEMGHLVKSYVDLHDDMVTQ